MLGIVNYSVFLTATLIFAITPGIDQIFVINKSISSGRRAGVAATFGIMLGGVVQIALAAFGLSAIVAIFPSAFFIIKYAGVAYMLYLGINALIGAGKPTKTVTGDKHKNRGHFLSGMLTNLLNPKIPIFFLAFIPQFVSPVAESKAVPFLILGMHIILIGFIWHLLLALLTGGLAESVSGKKGVQTAAGYVSGIVFLLLAAFMAFR